MCCCAKIAFRANGAEGAAGATGAAGADDQGVKGQGRHRSCLCPHVTMGQAVLKSSALLNS